jgi:transposase
VGEEGTNKDIIVMEAGGNSFEVCRRLRELERRVCVLESAHVGKHAKTYADNDKLASARIAMVFLAGNAPCVWIPDEQTRQYRDLLHAYRKAVSDHTAAINSFKSYLNGYGIRIGKRDPGKKTAQHWILGQAEWSDLQLHILQQSFDSLAQAQERRRGYYAMICKQMTDNPLMMRCMKLLGVGIVSAFGLLAIIGDIRRFESPAKLISYIGLNPGQRSSGRGKNIRLGIGRRGRGDIRNLLIQGAQSVLRCGRDSDLGKWGWNLFARKGSRNIAVAAIARKLLVKVWHLLSGNPVLDLEKDKKFKLKLQKLSLAIGQDSRKAMGLGKTITQCIDNLLQRCTVLNPQNQENKQKQEPLPA